jgi:Mce-associated membrane protein
MSKHRMPKGVGAVRTDKTETVVVDTEQVDAEQPDVEQVDAEQPDVEQVDAEQPDSEQVEEQTTEAQAARSAKRGISWARALAYGVLPGFALLLAVGAGCLEWTGSTAHNAEQARIESVRAATDTAIAMLTYRPDTVEKDLGAAQDRMTGQFKNSYDALTRDVVIPRAKQRQISAVANVPVAAPVSASVNHAVVLLFVNQTVIVGTEPATNTASSVRVTLDKIAGRWLISQYDPV